MIRAVFFDYDGVLTIDKTGSLTTHRHLAGALGVPLAEVQAAFRPHARSLTLGLATHAGIWAQLCEALGRDVPIALLHEAFGSTPPNEAMFRLARGLKGRYALGVITDNKRDRIDHLRRQQGLDALFDPIVVSADVGSDKEGPAIFQHALARLGIAAQDSVFIDNHRGNLVAAQALGLHTVFHDDERNDVDALAHELRERFGVVADGA